MTRTPVVVAGLGVATVLLIGVTQCQPFLAQRRLSDVAWLQTATPEQLRVTAHDALALRFGDPHDAFVILETHGDRSSIEVLQTALARQPARDHQATECTWVHGQDALERVLALPP